MATARDFKFCTRVGHMEYTFWWLTVPQVSVVEITWHILRFLHPLKYLCNAYSWRLLISYTTWLREVLALPCWLSPKWAWSGLRDSFLHFGAQAISLERMKLDISNLVCRLNAKSTRITQYTIMLKFCSMGVRLRSRDLLKFWEISASISETVQDRHIVTVESW